MSITLTASAIVPSTILDTGAFTRASTATYFDVDGVMQTAAIDVPRIGYDSATHAHTGLILEEARTNLLTYSEQFDNAAWTKSGSSITSNAVTAPDGTATADKLVESFGGTYHYVNRWPTLAAATHTFSIYAKAAENSVFALDLYHATDGTATVFFNVASGTVGSTNDSFIGAVASGIQAIGNGWYRCWITATPSAVATRIGMFLADGATETLNYSGDGASGIYIWGAQLEAGASPTSYIPTAAATVTRAADVVTGGGLIFCTTPEPASGETLWNAATNYSVGTVVARTTTHRLYENLIAGIDATLPEDATAAPTPRWLDLGATDRWAQFDTKIGTATTSAGTLTTVVKPGSTEGLALLDLIGRTAAVAVNSGSGGAVVYSATIDLDATVVESVYDWMFNEFVQKRNVLLTDLPGQYPGAVITVTVSSTTGSAIGVLAVGRVMTIGATEYGAGAGIINFGKVADDGFGNRTWIEGEWANRVTLPLVANNSDLNRIHRQLAGVRSTPCIYIGSSLDSMEPLVCYGVYRDLYITIPHYSAIHLNLEIDGMNNA